MEIVPAILAETFDDCLRMLRQAESFTKYVQIDVMDGRFVPSKSFPLEDIHRIDTSLFFEIHLMVQNPLAQITSVHHPQLKKVIFHFESDVNPMDCINQIKERKMIPGMAINPETQIDQFREVSENVDTLLFLTVDPGAYGSPFKPEVLGKIEKVRKIFPNKIISVDGGISLDNLKLFMDLAVDTVCVGSRIFLKGTPEENYMKFVNKIKELGGNRST
jgi:ribulose-phosphate 3-epimerase